MTAPKTFSQAEVDEVVRGRVAREQREIRRLTDERNALAGELIAVRAELDERRRLDALGAEVARLRATLAQRGIVGQIRKWFTGGNS
jgi:hypothetical protein